MPRANARNLAKTLVGLAGKAGDAPAGDDALKSLTLGDTDGVEHLVLGEDIIDVDGLLKEAAGVVDLGLDGAAVDLDLHNVGLLLSLTFLIWVCAMTRITEQCFFMRASSNSISFLPSSSDHFLAYLVNAFFFARYQFL